MFRRTISLLVGILLSVDRNEAVAPSWMLTCETPPPRVDGFSERWTLSDRNAGRDPIRMVAVPCRHRHRAGTRHRPDHPGLEGDACPATAQGSRAIGGRVIRQLSPAIRAASSNTKGAIDLARCPLGAFVSASRRPVGLDTKAQWKPAAADVTLGSISVRSGRETAPPPPRSPEPAHR